MQPLEFIIELCLNFGCKYIKSNIVNPKNSKELNEKYMKNKVFQENERKFYLSEFSYYDGEYEITFNIVDVDFDRQSITVAITRAGKITQDTFPLLKDNSGNLYFEYGRFYENKIALDDFCEVD